jgi:PKD repeat protein
MNKSVSMRLIRVQALFSTLSLIVFFSLISLAYPTTVNAQIVHATPSFVYSPLTPRVGDVVTFDALWWEQYWNENYEPRTFSYSWHFGDGTYATGVTVNHTFTNPGTYTVGVTVDDNLGLGGTSEMEIEVGEQTPVTVYISLSSDSVYTGEEVTISGSLLHNGIGVPDVWVFLSSQTYVEGASWNEIASVKTDDYGKYSAVWKPLYGSYQIKATWAGNSTYPETSISVNLNVKRFGDLITEFASNSTITGLNFNSSTRVLSFSAEGPSGTVGFVKIALEKESTFNPHGIIVLLDDVPVEYTIDSTNQSWIVGITYTHSIHNVIVYFNEGKIPEVPLFIFIAIMIVLITFLVILLTRSERKKQ